MLLRTASRHCHRLRLVYHDVIRGHQAPGSISSYFSKSCTSSDSSGHQVRSSWARSAAASRAGQRLHPFHRFRMSAARSRLMFRGYGSAARCRFPPAASAALHVEASISRAPCPGVSWWTMSRYRRTQFCQVALGVRDSGPDTRPLRPQAGSLYREPGMMSSICSRESAAGRYLTTRARARQARDGGAHPRYCYRCPAGAVITIKTSFTRTAFLRAISMTCLSSTSGQGSTPAPPLRRRTASLLQGTRSAARPPARDCSGGNAQDCPCSPSTQQRWDILARTHLLALPLSRHR